MAQITRIHRPHRGRSATAAALTLMVISHLARISAGAPDDDSRLLLLSTPTGSADGAADEALEDVVGALNANRKGILTFRITPSLFGRQVRSGNDFDSLIRANQGDEPLAYFHDLGTGAVEIYSPGGDAIQGSIPLSESQWPTLEAALHVTVQTGGGASLQGIPAEYKDGSVRVAGSPAFNRLVGALAGNLRETELLEPLVFPLKYATAEDTSINLSGSISEIKSEGVRKQLERFLFGQVGGSGNKILADAKQNAIIIVARPEMRPYYQGIIDKLDVERELVEITAAIIDIEASTGLEWQSQFVAAGMEHENSAARFNAGLGVGDDFFPGDGDPPDLPAPDLVNGRGLNVATMLVGSNYRVINKLKALEQTGVAKFMSRPSVLTIDNQPARITDTVTAYLPVRGERQSQLYGISSGINLTILPRIVDKLARGKEDRRVYLAIDVGDGNVSTGGASATPLQTDNRIATQTILRDGESLLVGGRYINHQRDDESGVPILKRIPVLGLAFKEKTVQNGRLQRLYLITPRILTWREAQLREHEAADMLATADASAADASALTTEGFPETPDPPRALPYDQAEDGEPAMEKERGLFRGRVLDRLRRR